jgi:hypothetical protein
MQFHVNLRKASSWVETQSAAFRKQGSSHKTRRVVQNHNILYHIKHNNISERHRLPATNANS